MEIIQQEIMQLMSLISQNKTEQAKNKIGFIRDMINENLDFATNDDDLVRYAKFLKIIEDIEQKV